VTCGHSDGWVKGCPQCELEYERALALSEHMQSVLSPPKTRTETLLDGARTVIRSYGVLVSEKDARFDLLARNVRRMLRSLDGYWATSNEVWWNRYEFYRERVEQMIAGGDG